MKRSRENSIRNVLNGLRKETNQEVKEE